MTEKCDWFELEKLHRASGDGELQEVERLIENGYDVNAFDEDLAQTPLHRAVISCQLDVVEYLISVGADVNAHDPERIGETPLGEVASNCSYEVARILVDAGANPTIKGWVGKTALDSARARRKASRFISYC